MMPCEDRSFVTPGSYAEDVGIGDGAGTTGAHDPVKSWLAAMASGREALILFRETAVARAELARHILRHGVKSAFAAVLTAIAWNAVLVFAACMALYGLSHGVSAFAGRGPWLGDAVVGTATVASWLCFLGWNRRLKRREMKRKWREYEEEFARSRARTGRDENAPRH